MTLCRGRLPIAISSTLRRRAEVELVLLGRRELEMHTPGFLHRRVQLFQRAAELLGEGGKRLVKFGLGHHAGILSAARTLAMTSASAASQSSTSCPAAKPRRSAR